MKKFFLGLSILFLFCFTAGSFAIEDFTISENKYDEQTRSLTILINDNRTSGQTPNAVSGSIEGTEIKDASYLTLDKTDTPITFVFVVDNTTTAYDDQKRRPIEIANTISSARTANNRGAGDEYYLISYDTEVHKPVGPFRYPEEMFTELTYNVNSIKADYSRALINAADLLNKSLINGIHIPSGDRDVYLAFVKPTCLIVFVDLKRILTR